MKNKIIKTPYRIKVILYSLLICIPLIFIVQKAYADIVPILQLLLFDETDPPDVCGDSSIPELRIGEKYSDKITPGDHDYFKITTPDFYRNIKLFTTGSTDTLGQLYEAPDCTNILDFNDDETQFVNFNFSFDYNLEPGKIYYLLVRGYNTTKTGGYTVFAQQTNEYIYLSAKYAGEEERKLGAGIDRPYFPEYQDAEYSVNRGPNIDNPGISGDESLVYDSVDESYYYTVDPNGERETVQEWKLKNGFIDAFGNQTPNVVSAEYVNAYDLGLGRKMSCINDGETFPCIVENYLVGPDFNRDPPERFAFVAMERVNNRNHTGSLASDDNRYYTAFYAYDANGDRVNSVDLDGSGPKRVPEVCWSCHDGTTQDNINSNSTEGKGSFDGQYLPFDVALFKKFPGSLQTIQEQINLDKFEKLNQIITDIYHNDKVLPVQYHGPSRVVHEQISKLVQYWKSSGNPYSDNKSMYEKNDVFVFDSTLGYDVYVSHRGGSIGHYTDSTRDHSIRDFYAHYCRTCHIAQPRIIKSRPTEFSEMKCTVCHGEGDTLNKIPKCEDCHADTARAATLPNLKAALCKGTPRSFNHMPNAKVTHLRFIQENFDSDGNVIAESKLGKLAKPDGAVTDNLCPDGYETEIYPKN